MQCRVATKYLITPPATPGGPCGDTTTRRPCGFWFPAVRRQRGEPPLARGFSLGEEQALLAQQDNWAFDD
jgi:hypothetical protein